MTVRLLLGTLAAAASVAPVTISGPSSLGNCPDGQGRDVVRAAEVEPYVAVDPHRPSRVIAVYQQDRFRNGAARAVAASVSADGGKTWKQQVLPVGFCATRGPGPARVTDPWVSIGAEGRIYALASAFVVTSMDGGRTWSEPFELAQRTQRYFLDKGSLTADPVRRGTAYAVWARFIVPPNGPPVQSDAMLSRTTDGGRTWSPPRSILARGPDSGPIGSVIVPDTRRGLLYHLAFWQVGEVPTMKRPSHVLVQSSRDGGLTWSRPHRVGFAYTVAVLAFEAHSGTQIRTGFVVPSLAVDPRSGTLYAVWQDARFSGRRFDQIVISRSRDRGATWSRPVRVGAPGRQGLVGNVAVLDNGIVGVGYFDTPAGRSAQPVKTRYVLATSRDGGRTFARRTVGAPFDLERAPLMASVPEFLVPPGLFLGDYMGLVAHRNAFHLAYVTTNATPDNPTDVRYAVVRP